MKKKTVVIIIGVIGLLGAIAYFGTSFWLSMQTKLKYIEWGEDMIPTLYQVVGEREIESFEDEISTLFRKKQISYKTGSVSSDDIAIYAYNLYEQGYVFMKFFDEEGAQLGIESKDEDMIIVVDVLYPSNQVTITYTKFKGTLERYWT